MIINYYAFAITFGFVLLDILSGITQALKNKILSSETMRNGIYHKLSYVLVLALASLAEYSVNYMDLGFSTPLITPCAVMICLTETISIVENIEKINPELTGTGIFKLISSRKNDDE